MPDSFNLNSYLDLISPVHHAKPRFMALASAVLGQVTDLLSLYGDQLPGALSLDTAQGFFLDTLAALSGFLRPTPGMTDESFREYLRAKIQCNHWNGQNETLPGILAMAFPGAEAVLTDNQDGTVTASLSDDTQFPLEDLFPCPAGIRLSVRES